MGFGGFWSFESGLERMECTPMRCLRTNGLHSMTKLFSCLLKFLVLQTKKNPRDGVLGFGGIAKCLINTALYIGEESHV